MAITLPRAVNLKRALTLLGQAFGGTLEVDQLKWTYRGGVGLDAHDASFTRTGRGITRLSAKHLHFKISLLPLLAGKLVIRNLTLQQPEMTLSAKAEGPDEQTGRRAGASPLTVELREFQLNDGHIHIEDSKTVPGKTVNFQLTRIQAQIKGMNPGGNAEIAMSLGITDQLGKDAGSVSCKGHWQEKGLHLDLKNAHLELDGELQGLDSRLLRPYLARDRSAAELNGPIEASFRYTREPRGHGKAVGRVSLDSVEFADPTRWQQALPGARSRIDLEMDFKAKHMEVRLTRASLGNISASGQLEVHPGPICRRASFSAQLPVAETKKLIPWGALPATTQGLQELISEDGLIHVEKLTLPQIDLTKSETNFNTILQGIRARLSLQNLGARSGSAWIPDLSGLSGELHLRKNNLHSANLTLRAGPFQLPAVDLQCASIFERPLLSASVLGPVYIAADTSESIQSLLARYGVHAMQGNANIDLKARYQAGDASPWNARGLVHLHDLDITTLASESRLMIKGSIDANLSESLTIKCSKIRGSINEAPFLIDGLASGKGPSVRDIDLVDLEVSAEQTELAPVAEILPLDNEQLLAGIIEADASLRYLRGAPAETSLSGHFRGREFQYFDPSHGIEIDQGECRLEFRDNRIILEDSIILLNGQTLMCQGGINNLNNGNLALRINSPQLNVDKLIPRTSADEISTDQPQKPGTSRRLVNALEPLSIDLHIEVERGSYQRRPFNQFSLEAALSGGRVESHNLNIGLAGGKLGTRGSLDLAELDFWNFDLRIDIRSVHLEKLLPWLIKENRGYRGPASCKGSLSGHTGKGWLESLRGNLLLKAGPGKMPRVGALGDALHKTLALDRLKGQLTGTMSAHEAATIIPVEYLLLNADFEEAVIDVPTLVLNTPGAKTEWKGTLSVPELVLDMDIKVSLLGELDMALGLMPVLGRAASNMTKLYVRLEGPISNPRTTKTLHNSLDDLGTQPIRTLEKTVGKSLNNFKKFWS